MLDQLIYTRCLPHRDLKNKGQVIHADGFGVFSMSQQLIHNPPVNNYDFLQARLSIQNGAKETSAIGLFNSYEYTALSPDIYALSYEVARPLCKEPRKNGQGHRTGTYIKQCFVGKFNEYPCHWFGAAAWTAYKKSENDYYMDEEPNKAPELLPQISDNPAGGYIDIQKIKTFVADGRANAVKAGIWFLIHEFSKPEGERKVLLIKDIPENVELWIAAIEYGFSVDMAKSITFATNRSKLATQADAVLFYYTDDSGRFYPMINRGISQERHPYNMIVGFHPKDNFCSSIKQMSTSNFVIIDGTNKTTSFQPDNTIYMSYYSAVIRYDEDIKDFCEIILPNLPLKGIKSQLPQLFDAYKYLLDSNHKAEKWEYRETLSAVEALTQFGIPQKREINSYILGEGLKIYSKFVEEDEDNGYALLKIYWKLAKIVCSEHDVTGCLADRIINNLNSLQSSGSRLAKIWHAIKSAEISEIIHPALVEIFNDVELAVYARQFERASSSAVATVLDMYFSMLNHEQAGINAIKTDNEKYEFVCLGIVALMDDKDSLSEIFAALSVSGDMVNAVALSVSEYLERKKPTKTEQWWDIVIDMSGGDVVALCQNLYASKNATISMVEQILSNKVFRSGKCDKKVFDAFYDAMNILEKSSDTGKLFFESWIKVTEPFEYVSIISAIRKCSISLALEKELFEFIDGVFIRDMSESVISKAYAEMKSWEREVGCVSRSVLLYEFKHNFECRRDIKSALNDVVAFMERRLQIPDNFTHTEYFTDISKKVAEFADGELHITMLCLFDISERYILNKYIDTYIEIVLSHAKRGKLIEVMFSLCEAVVCKCRIPGREDAFVRDIQREMESSLSRQIIGYYKPGIVNQVNKLNGYDSEVKTKLITLLQDVEKRVGTKERTGGILGRLFGKR